MVARIDFVTVIAMSDSARKMVWASALIGAVIVLGILLLLARWLYTKMVYGKTRGEGFPIENLEKMRNAGQISAEEVKQLRLTAIDMADFGGKKNGDQSRMPQELDDEITDGADT